MKPKKVKWTEFNALGYQVAKENYPEARREHFETTYEGVAIHTYSHLGNANGSA